MTYAALPIDKKKDLIIRIVTNANSLLKESKILRNANALRRATFLAITAYEEIMKLTLLLEGNKEWFKHDAKFAKFNQQIKENVSKRVVPLFLEKLASKFQKQDVNADKLLESTAIELEKFFSNSFNLEKLRQALLYEDVKQRDQDFHIGESTIGILAPKLISFAEGQVAPCVALIQDWLEPKS